MADKKLNELSAVTIFDHAYVESSQNQYKISKTNLGQQLTNEVHTNFSVASDTPAYIFAQKSDGTNFRISKSDLAKAITNDSLSSSGTLDGNRKIFEGCFIMYHNQSDGYPRVVPYASWTSLQDSGEEADGVLIIEGGHLLVVAPEEKECYWSSKAGLGDVSVNYSSDNRVKLLDIWDGSKRTKKICTDASSPFHTESTQSLTRSKYAPGYCYHYTPHFFVEIGQSKPKKGLKAGQYWLPCVAELMMIYTHKYKINAGLALISGSNQLSETWYKSSTEESALGAWGLHLKEGYLGLRNKVEHLDKARPVSTFIHEGY